LPSGFLNRARHTHQQRFAQQAVFLAGLQHRAVALPLRKRQRDLGAAIRLQRFEPVRANAAPGKLVVERDNAERAVVGGLLVVNGVAARQLRPGPRGDVMIRRLAFFGAGGPVVFGAAREAEALARLARRDWSSRCSPPLRAWFPPGSTCAAARWRTSGLRRWPRRPCFAGGTATTFSARRCRPAGSSTRTVHTSAAAGGRHKNTHRFHRIADSYKI